MSRGLARPEEQLDQPHVGFRRGKRIGPVDPHPDLPPGTAQPYWHGQDLGFVVGRALGCCSSSIEKNAEPRRAQVDVDLVDADVDAVDQSSEDSPPASYRQLGPALCDLRGPRDKPPLS